MKKVQKIAILGSGIMGTGIACHFANAGFDVLLLDMVPKELDPAEKDPAKRNMLANASLKQAMKTDPAPLFTKETANRITTGNFEDDLHRINEYDWIMEVVIERLDIKKQLLAKVDEFRAPATLVTSNTSGIPIHLMSEGRSDDFRRHFCGTHFFNPPRYLRLLEIIPGPDTLPAVLDYLKEFGDIYLGKETVIAKDTPAFIANRVGVVSLSKIYELTEKLGLSIEAVDKLTGPAIGRPKTGTYRLSDLVGLDTAAKVLEGVRDNCPQDKQMAAFTAPSFLEPMIRNNWLGNKTGQGFYKKTDERDEKGKRIILGLDLKTLEYRPDPKERLDSIGLVRQISDPKQRIKALFNAEDQGGKLIRETLAAMFAYASNRIPEIADDIYQIDTAVKTGFVWDFGPFEYWDIIGLQEGIQAAEDLGYSVSDWAKKLASDGVKAFYRVANGKREYFSRSEQRYMPVPTSGAYIILDHQREKAPVFENEEVQLHDIGDGVLCLEFTSPHNAIGEGILRGLQRSIAIAEDDWKGLVIGNNAQHFTVGANLMLIGMMAFQQQWDQLDMAVDLFQQTSMRCRYSTVPVVAATQGYTFGGGCEFLMHCDATMAAAESYIGLVEVGVGLLPGGGGTKEFAVRTSDSFGPGDVQIPTLIERFRTIATASVGRSAMQAFDLGYLRKGYDEIVMNTKRNIGEAKRKVLELSRHYVPKQPRTDITVLGRQGLASLYVAANSLYRGNYASEHDITIAKKIAWVLCGGDLTGAQQVSEQYLLDVEREAFLSLAGEPKTLERIQYMMENNKPLRN